MIEKKIAHFDDYNLINEEESVQNWHSRSIISQFQDLIIEFSETSLD